MKRCDESSGEKARAGTGIYPWHKFFAREYETRVGVAARVLVAAPGDNEGLVIEP
jgi:hypothetical protein